MRKKVLIGMAVVFGILLIAAVGVYFNRETLLKYAMDLIDYNDVLTVDRPQKSADEEEVFPFSDQNYVTVLFLGIDRTVERDSILDGYRSDSIALIRMQLDTKTINVLSIPRDTYTYVPIEGKKDKINHAYAYGDMQGTAVESTQEAVQELVKGLPIDYYMVMDMEHIPDIVDDIGGVVLDVDCDMKTYGADLSKGVQLCNGKQAFDYIHWRFSGQGDIDRIGRQQKFLKAVFKKQRDSGQLVETVKIVLKYKDSLKTSLNPIQMVALAKYFSEITEDDIHYYVIPGNSQNINGVSYWVPHPQEAQSVINEFLGSPNEVPQTPQ